MARHEEFTHIHPDLRPILEEIRSREPIFHTRAFGTTRAGFEAVMAPDCWEVGASGRRYGREFILRLMDQNPPVDAASDGWRTEDIGLRRLGPNAYLFTYTLSQAERITRRATIWECLETSAAWRRGLAALAEAAAPGRAWYRRCSAIETYAMVGETSGRLKTLFDEYGEI